MSLEASLDEALQQERPATRSAAGNPPAAGASRAAKDASQVGHTRPRHDEESGVVEDQIQPAAPLLGIPADPLIAWGEFPGGSAETPELPPDSPPWRKQIAKLSPRQISVAQIVILLDQAVPQSGLRAGQRPSGRPRAPSLPTGRTAAVAQVRIIVLADSDVGCHCHCGAGARNQAAACNRSNATRAFIRAGVPLRVGHSNRRQTRRADLGPVGSIGPIQAALESPPGSRDQKVAHQSARHRFMAALSSTLRV